MSLRNEYLFAGLTTLTQGQKNSPIIELMIFLVPDYGRLFVSNLNLPTVRRKKLMPINTQQRHHESE